MSLNKILIISESIDVNDSSASKGRVALIQNLHKAGFQLKVYHYTRKNIQLKGVECVNIKEIKSSKYFFLSKALLIIQRIFKKKAVQYFEKKIGFSYTFLNDSNSIADSIKNENPQDYSWLITLSKGASFRSHHAALKLTGWHQKWLAYVHDPFPFHYYPKPYDWNMPGYIQKELFFLEVTQKAKYILFPSLLLKEWMEQYFPDIKKKGIIIPHQITELKHKAILPQYFNKDKFTIVHAGNLMKPRNPEGLMEAFELFLKENPEALDLTQLLFLGAPGYYKNLFADKKKHLFPLYISDGYVKFEETIEIHIHASVNVIIEAKSDTSPFLPGKFPICVQANRPILLLGPEKSETRRLLGVDYQYWSEIDDVLKIKFIITQLYHLWKENNYQKLNRSDLVDYMGVTHLKKTFLELKS